MSVVCLHLFWKVWIRYPLHLSELRDLRYLQSLQLCYVLSLHSKHVGAVLIRYKWFIPMNVRWVYVLMPAVLVEAHLVWVKAGTGLLSKIHVLCRWCLESRLLILKAIHGIRRVGGWQLHRIEVGDWPFLAMAQCFDIWLKIDSWLLRLHWYFIIF